MSVRTAWAPRSRRLCEHPRIRYVHGPRCGGCTAGGVRGCRRPGAVTRGGSAGLPPPCAAAPRRLRGGRGRTASTEPWCSTRRRRPRPRPGRCRSGPRSTAGAEPYEPFGPVGVGKTHVAQALGHQAVRQGASVRFTKTSRILAELAGGHADRTWDKRMRELVRPDLLILDDFAMRQLSASQADDLYELVSERQGRSLITTSDRAPSDWCPLFPNPVVAESLLDRLINAGRQVIMNGPSYRPGKRPRNSTDPTDPPLHEPTAGPSSRPGGMRWHDPLRPPLSWRGSCCICCHCTTQSRNTRRTSITPGRVHPDLGSVLRTNG
ncbi:ATP-binding protein [Streptomyces sp. NPDC058291]|uniref:ATP-binding protein n=1 Tax=Streptomyces sp. NPDC058291 TaxID=3346427 RepID=UPI0036E2841D